MRDSIAPFNYFGVSKLGCLACQLFFTAYNTAAQQLHFPVYHIRGSHGKLYQRWAAPNFIDISPELQKIVADKMVASLKTELANHMELIRQRALSDSSSGSRVESGLIEDSVTVEDDRGTFHLWKLW
jgi:hypothetical protein